MGPRGILVAGLAAFLVLLVLVWAADQMVRIDRQGAVCAKLGQQVRVDIALTSRRGLVIEATCVGRAPVRAI